MSTLPSTQQASRWALNTAPPVFASQLTCTHKLDQKYYNVHDRRRDTTQHYHTHPSHSTHRDTLYYVVVACDTPTGTRRRRSGLAGRRSVAPHRARGASSFLAVCLAGWMLGPSPKVCVFRCLILWARMCWRGGEGVEAVSSHARGRRPS